MTRTYPLGVARAVAVRTLTELGTQRPGWRPNPDYWMELLAEALRQMVDATAPDRVIDVAPLPEHTAASAAEVAEDVVGRLVEDAHDDSPCPAVGRVVGQIDDETLEVLWDGAAHASHEPFDALRPVRDGVHAEPAPAGHLAQHTGGQPGCTYPDCRIHQPAPTREADAAVLAAHPLDGGQ